MTATHSPTQQNGLHHDQGPPTGSKRKAGDASSHESEQQGGKKQLKVEDMLNSKDLNETPDSTVAQDKQKDGQGLSEEDGMEDKVDTRDVQPEPETHPAKSEDIEKNSKASLDDAIQESSQRENQLSSNILEKGLVYFFTRNRVNVEEADSVDDLQRTFFVLRPLPPGTKLGEGTLPDLENNRLLALPKKVFPKSQNDRFMAFVEKAPTTIQDLKENFFGGSEYETKTSGSRRVDPVTPVAEGVYAITRTEDTSTHLAYSITIPSVMGEVQEDLGLRSQGSFIISLKNPKRPGPANTNLPQRPEFPEEFIEAFRGLAWVKVQPEYLDYANAQILLIGENLQSAFEPSKKDEKHGKEGPQVELERLENEDELRVEHLSGDDSVFDDLRISKADYPNVPTTCGQLKCCLPSTRALATATALSRFLVRLKPQTFPTSPPANKQPCKRVSASYVNNTSMAQDIDIEDGANPKPPAKTTKKPSTEPNVLEVVLGSLPIKPWYPSFYPEELVGRRVDRLNVCQWCFKYTKELPAFLGHLTACPYRDSAPPGGAIYAQSNLAIYELDGAEHKLYAQNLSLFAKLFLDTKSVFYDVTTFLYYLLVLKDPSPAINNTRPSSQDTGGDVERGQIVGFFSKEKMSWDNNNLACICIFPPWQKQGLGQVLMAASYELGRKERRMGGPEKPLSDLGRLAYIHYWSQTLARTILAVPAKRTLSVADLRDETYIAVDDIISTLQSMDVLEHRKKGGAQALINKAKVRIWAETYKVDLKNPVDPDAFVIETSEEEEDGEEGDEEEDGDEEMEE
ncbi:unnamed protein product [Periconia digitata]|uniref:histone acetyltransferase n=1 Tax=Periconia digitata TaxID=1303443 RepID=A0A9W4UEU4_9PLEO|nr:unnamed protein product [Periconia digitata]